MTSTVALDPLDFEAAAGNFRQIQLSAVVRLGSLSRELRQYDNMAGTDSGGQAFATEYDANAMSIVQALDYLAIRASEFDSGLTATAAAHDLAEQWAAGNVAGASSFTPRPVFAGENPSPPPSAFGGDPTPPPEPWGTVKEFIGAMWPDANIDTLNRAAATWRRIGDNLDEVAREVRRADDPLAATRSGEIAAIRTRVAELADTIALIARDADEVGASCEEYAAIVHAAHEEVFAMLRQLAIEIIAGIGIGVALSFFTFGAAGAAATGVLAARIVSVAARITQTILKVLSFAQKAAGRFAAVHGRLVAAVARLTPRSQTFIRVGNQVVAETSAAVLSEGVVRGENANYLSAFAGGFVGAGTTAGVLSIFGRRADTVLANVVGGTAGGFTGSVAATGVTGNISVENLIMGTVMGTAGGTLGGGGTARSGTDVNAPTPTGQQSAPISTGGNGGAQPRLGEAPIAPGVGDAPSSPQPSTAPTANAPLASAAGTASVVPATSPDSPSAVPTPSSPLGSPAHVDAPHPAEAPNATSADAPESPDSLHGDSDVDGASADSSESATGEEASGPTSSPDGDASHNAETTAKDDSPEFNGSNASDRTLDDIDDALEGINPKFDINDPAGPYANNCGNTASNMHDFLNGSPVRESPAGTLTTSDMQARTDLPQTSATPTQIEATLRSLGPGSHCVVGVDRTTGTGHWFNAYFDGTKVWSVDAQTGARSPWPPHEPNASGWDASLRPEDLAAADPKPDAPGATAPGTSEATAPQNAPERTSVGGQVRLDGGSMHAPTASRADLGGLPPAEVRITELAEAHGLTRDEFHDLAYNTPVTALSPDQARIVLDVRQTLDPPAPGTVMQKMLPGDAALSYLDGTYTPNEVGGFVAVGSDVAPLADADAVFHGLGLDYANNPFQRADGSVEEVFAVRFRLDDDAAALLRDPVGPLQTQAGLTPGYDPGVGAPGVGGNPFLGNGFVGKGDDAIIPEYHLPTRVEIDDGSEMWRIGADGSEELFAVLVKGSWQLVS